MSSLVFLILRRFDDLSTLQIHRCTQTAHQILAKPKFLMIGNEAGHLGINKLFAKQLVRCHVGQSAQFFGGEL